MSLHISHLGKRFGGVIALDDVNMELPPGSIHGLMGPNGAGKTTLLNVIGGTVPADAGRILWNGRDLLQMPAASRFQLGIARTFQVNKLIPDLSALDNVLLWHRGRRPGDTVWGAWFRRRAWRFEEARAASLGRTVLQRFSLADQAGTPAGELSFGQRKLLALACLEVAEPRLLLLDEPFAGLAPVMVETARAFLRRLAAGGCSVLLVEHSLDTLLGFADRIVFMDRGQVIVEGKPEEIRTDPRVQKAYLQ